MLYNRGRTPAPNVDEAIKEIFELYFQRNFGPELHENCPGCKRELSPEEMEKDLRYQEKLAELFSKTIKKTFSDEEIISHLYPGLKNGFVSKFLELAFVFCYQDATELRRSIFGDEGFDGNEYNERRIV